MKLFKNGVGRPSNETRKKRKLFVFGTVTLSIVSGLLVALLISHISINNLSGKALGNYSGDIDGDGLVTQKDVQKIMRFSSKLEKYTSDELKIADMNKDGKITTKDVTLAKKVASKNYTIIFNNSRAKNPEGKMNNVEMGKNAIYLPECDFENEGYVFNGWIVQRMQDGKYYGKINNKKDWYTQKELFNDKKKGSYITYGDKRGISLYKLGVKEGTKVTLYANWKKLSTKKTTSKSNSGSKTTTKNRSSGQRRCENAGNYWYSGKCYRNKTKLISANGMKVSECASINGVKRNGYCYYNLAEYKTLCSSKGYDYRSEFNVCNRYYNYYPETYKDLCKDSGGTFINNKCYKSKSVMLSDGMKVSECTSRNGKQNNGYCYYGTPKY